MNRRIPILLVLLFCGLFAHPQLLDSSRITNWQKAGLISEFDNSGHLYKALDLGANNDGYFDNTLIVNDIISNLDSASTIYFAEGFYRFTNTIRLKSGVTLMGELGKTYFLFDSMPNSDCIELKGNFTSQSTDLVENTNTKQRYIIAKNTKIAANDIVYIWDTDSALVTSSWARNATGQFVKVKEVSGDTMFLTSKLRRKYSIGLNAQVRKVNPIQNVSIQNISIVKNDSTTAQTTNIDIDKAFNCEVKCVESYSANFAHVAISNSLNVNVVDSYFKDGQGYGGGGRAYGVVLQFGTSECMVFNNAFEHLRHSMLLQAGANGNFVGYNYSVNPYWTETLLASDAAGDLVLHGNYVYANLLEGNVVQNIVIDDSHGKNGPNNVFFRNRAEGYGIFMNPQTPSDSQIYIGNEVTNTSFSKGLYALAGKGHLEYGNNVRGTCIPENTTVVKVNSLYFGQKPELFEAIQSWPIIGYPTSFKSKTNLANLRFYEGQKTACTPKTGSAYSSLLPSNILIYPTPTTGVFHLNGDIKVEDIELFDINGKRQIVRQLGVNEFAISLPSGVYYIRVYENGYWNTAKLMVR